MVFGYTRAPFANCFFTIKGHAEVADPEALGCMSAHEFAEFKKRLPPAVPPQEVDEKLALANALAEKIAKPCTQEQKEGYETELKSVIASLTAYREKYYPAEISRK